MAITLYLTFYACMLKMCIAIAIMHDSYKSMCLLET